MHIYTCLWKVGHILLYKYIYVTLTPQLNNTVPRKGYIMHRKSMVSYYISVFLMWPLLGSLFSLSVDYNIVTEKQFSV